MSQFIAKSGGNTYHGKIYADYENENIQSRNIDRRSRSALGLKAGGGLSATDLNRLHSYHDLNGDVGGYIKQDKLWWYGSLRDQNVQSRCCRTSRSSRSRRTSSNITGKVHLRAQHQQQARSAFAQWGKKQQPNRLDTFLVARDRGHPQQRRLDLEPGLLGAHLQGRLGQRRQRQDVLRGPRRPVPLPVAEHALHDRRRPTQTSRTNIVSGGNRDGWFAHPDAQPGARLAQLLQGRLGAAVTTSRSAASSSTSASTTCAGRTASARCRATCCTILRNGVAVRSAPLPVADRVAERPADERRCTSPTPGG